MRARVPLISPVFITLLACSEAAPPANADAGWGGAPFVVWPPQEGEGSSDQYNPWLNGDPSDPGSPGAGGRIRPGEPSSTTGGTGGGEPPLGGPPGSGGQEAIDTPIRVTPARLRFRAYVESTTAFKAVMVEHVAGDPSTACSVELHSNGNSEVWRSLDVPEGLALGETALLCIPKDASAACSVGFGGSAYNGNDALVLRCEGRVEDVFGVIGVDPGKSWTGTGFDGAPLQTIDAGLWRCDLGLDSDAEGFSLSQWIAWDWGADSSFRGPDCPPPAGWGGESGL